MIEALTTPIRPRRGGPGIPRSLAARLNDRRRFSRPSRFSWERVLPVVGLESRLPPVVRPEGRRICLGVGTGLGLLIHSAHGGHRDNWSMLTETLTARPAPSR